MNRLTSLAVSIYTSEWFGASFICFGSFLYDVTFKGDWLHSLIILYVQQIFKLWVYAVLVAVTVQEFCWFESLWYCIKCLIVFNLWLVSFFVYFFEFLNYLLVQKLICWWELKFFNFLNIRIQLSFPELQLCRKLNILISWFNFKCISNMRCLWFWNPLTNY